MRAVDGLSADVVDRGIPKGVSSRSTWHWVLGKRLDEGKTWAIVRDGCGSGTSMLSSHALKRPCKILANVVIRSRAICSCY